MKMPRTRKKVLWISAFAAGAALISVGAALAVSTVLVDNAVTVNDGTFMSAHARIKLQTKGPARIRDVYNTAVPPGIVANWHTHPGPVIVAMTDTTAGSLTMYGEGCEVMATIHAGQAFVEQPNEPIFVRNNSTNNADWVTTMIVPPGVPHTVFLTPPPPPCT
jgi:quercetin dioxygenase-like cupin family protein